MVCKSSFRYLTATGKEPTRRLKVEYLVVDLVLISKIGNQSCNASSQDTAVTAHENQCKWRQGLMPVAPHYDTRTSGSN